MAAAAGSVRKTLSDARGDPRRGEPVQGGPDGARGPDHVLPADGAPRAAAQPARRCRGRGGVTQPRRTPTEHRRGLDIARGPAPPAEPLAGVSSEAITTATRRVAERWRDEVAARQPDVGDPHMVAGVLAALALAIDQRRPGYVTQLVPRPAPTLADRLVEMLQTELLRSWSQTADTISPRAILGTLNALGRAAGAHVHSVPGGDAAARAER